MLWSHAQWEQDYRIWTVPWTTVKYCHRRREAIVETRSFHFYVNTRAIPAAAGPHGQPEKVFNDDEYPLSINVFSRCLSIRKWTDEWRVLFSITCHRDRKSSTVQYFWNWAHICTSIKWQLAALHTAPCKTVIMTSPTKRGSSVLLRTWGRSNHPPVKNSVSFLASCDQTYSLVSFWAFAYRGIRTNGYYITSSNRAEKWRRCAKESGVINSVMGIILMVLKRICHINQTKAMMFEAEWIHIRLRLQKSTLDSGSDTDWINQRVGPTYCNGFYMANSRYLGSGLCAIP